MSLSTATLFEGLVRNAISFFERALDKDEIQNYPKYSLLNFVSAVELLLKARLMHEHWSLILEKPELADFDKFKDGDFKSVSIKIALQRIEKILSEKIGKDQIGEIEHMRNYRNKLVHFFDETYLGAHQPEYQQKIQLIVKEQCRTWYRLYNLINGKWKNIFAPFNEDLQKINNLIHQNTTFLIIKYDEIKPNLDASEANGVVLLKCLSCGKKSIDTNQQKSDLPIYIKCLCQVCELQGWQIIFECSGCPTVNVYTNDSSHLIVCTCGSQIDIEEFIRREFELDITHIEDHQSLDIQCCYCNSDMIAEIDEGWLCLNCLTEFEFANSCEFCSQLYACEDQGYLQDSFLEGCGNCPGRGWG